MVMRRGEVWWVALDPTIGSEIQKTRPCLILSPDVMIAGLRTVLVAPMTSRGRVTSFRPALSFKGKTGLILLDQLRAVDRSRLRNKMGRVSDDTLANALGMLRWIFTE
jgi:mRNA interferase MazF